MLYKKSKGRVIGLFSAVWLMIAAILPYDGIVYASEEDTKFKNLTDTFALEIFYEMGGLAQHFTVENPESKNPEIANCDLDESNYTEQQLIAELENIDINKLSPDNKYRYRQIIQSVRRNSEVDPLYYESLSGMGGEHVGIILELSLYEFNGMEDIEHYFTLMENLPEYFDKLISNQQTRFDNGLFMSDKNAENVIAFCDGFIVSGEENPLLKSFEHRLAQWDITNSAFAEELLAKNSDIINNCVIPSYRKLRDFIAGKMGLSAFRLPGETDGTKRFYEAYAQASVGTSLSIPQMKTLLETAYQKAEAQMEKFLGNAYFTETMEDRYALDYPSNPEELTDWLINKTNSDPNYPSLANVEYSAEQLDPFFRNYMNPAFIFSPPVDNAENFRIFWSSSSRLDTAAHELAPGHLWQMLYDARNEPYYIDRITETLGRVEGWAQYAELSVWEYALADPTDIQMIEYLKLEANIQSYKMALADIYVNYDAVSPAELAEKIPGYSEYYHEFFALNSGAYLPYTVGQLMIENLQTQAREELGTHFDLYKLNIFLLDNINLDFDLLTERFYNDYLGLINSAVTEPESTAITTSETTAISNTAAVSQATTAATFAPVTTLPKSPSHSESLNEDAPRTGDITILTIGILSTAAILVACGISILRVRTNKDDN